MKNEPSGRGGVQRIQEIFGRVVEEGWRPETSIGATEDEISQVLVAQGVPEIPEAVREVLRLIGHQPGLWSSGSLFGIANMTSELKQQAQSMLDEVSSPLGDGSDVLALFGHGGYEYHVIAGSDLVRHDPPVWLLRELDFEDEDGNAIRVEKFWDSVSMWFEFLANQVIRSREAFAKRRRSGPELLARYFRS